MRSFNADLVTAALSLALGLFMLAVMPSQGGDAVWAALRDVHSTAFFPSLAALVMVLFGAVLLVRAISDQREGKGVPVSFPRSVSVAGATAVMIFFLVATAFLGMISASVGAIVLLGLLIDRRHWKIVAAAAVLMPIGIYVLFERVLRILLPKGLLF